MKEKSVYLAGPISGLTYDECTDWRDYATKQLAPEIVAYSPMRAKEVLREVGEITNSLPDEVLKASPFTNQQAIVARDRYDVQMSKIVLMNLLGAKKVSIGTMVELGWADAFRTPVVLVWEGSEENIHWHEFVRALGAWHVHTLDQGIAACRAVLNVR